MKEILENTVRKSKKVEHNEDREGTIYSESIWVNEKESRRNKAITVNVYRTKSSLLINGPRTQKFILEVIPIIQLWALENKIAVNISDPKLKKVLGKLKVEQHQSKTEEQVVKEESGNDSDTMDFDFVTESKNREVKLGIEGHKKRERKKKMRKK